MYKISIIIPVYLSERYLIKNFNCLIGQSYFNMEIIYINDGSTDASGVICDEFARSDSRVKVIHQENGGAAKALNTGLDYATGDFIMFLDADDWIESNTCELAVNAAIKFKSDMIFWPNIKEYKDKSVQSSPFFYESKEFNNKGINFLRRRMIGLVREELANPMSTDAFNAGWGKLYRSAAIKVNNVRWQDTKYVGSSDVLFNAHLMPHIKSAYYLNIYLHHYNKNNPNSLTKNYGNTLQEKLSNLFKELKDIIDTNYKEIEEYNIYMEALNNRIALSTINIGMGFASNGMSSNGYKMFCQLITSSKYKNSYKKFPIRFCPFHYKLFFFTCKYQLKTFAYLLVYVMSKMRVK